MKWNKHSNLEGSHAFLGASTYHWINYTEEKLASVYKKRIATIRGTILHEFASQCIKLRQKLPKSAKTLNQFVNDAIGFSMSSEVLLYYSDNCFGTADAIYFGNQGKKSQKPILRIHDLKTGETAAHMEQLLVYTALFCLEYKIKPADIDIELRIYQADNMVVMNPTVEDIAPIIDKIITFDKIINRIKEEEGDDYYV